MKIEIANALTTAVVPPSSFILIFGILNYKICLRGGCHMCHNYHIEMKNSKNTPLFPPLDAFSEK